MQDVVTYGGPLGVKMVGSIVWEGGKAKEGPVFGLAKVDC